MRRAVLQLPSPNGTELAARLSRARLDIKVPRTLDVNFRTPPLEFCCSRHALLMIAPVLHDGLAERE